MLRPPDGGVFNFARVLRRAHGPDAAIELKVDNDGSAKDIPLRQCPKYVRPLRPEVEMRLRRVSSNNSSSTSSQKQTSKPTKKPDPKEEAQHPHLLVLALVNSSSWPLSSS